MYGKRGLRGPRLCDDGMNYYASGSISFGSLFRMPYYAVWYALMVCRMDMAYGIPIGISDTTVQKSGRVGLVGSTTAARTSPQATPHPQPGSKAEQ